MTTRKFLGKVALVTGAGKRLGRAIALRLAEEGADVVVHYGNSAKDAADVVGRIEEMGQKAVALQANLQDVNEIRKLFLDAGNELGKLDLLVNSAANFLPGSVISTTEEIWDASLDTNVKAPFFCSQAAAPMLRRSKGAVVNFADTGGTHRLAGILAAFSFESRRRDADQMLGQGAGPGSESECHRARNDYDAGRSPGVGKRLRKAGATQ